MVYFPISYRGVWTNCSWLGFVTIRPFASHGMPFEIPSIQMKSPYMLITFYSFFIFCDSFYFCFMRAITPLLIIKYTSTEFFFIIIFCELSVSYVFVYFHLSDKRRLIVLYFRNAMPGCITLSLSQISHKQRPSTWGDFSWFAFGWNNIGCDEFVFQVY